ncbi:MAG: hypothetical protein ACOX9B_10885 [Candidatus Xenobium sp.]|jgi:hypothetical protein|nr:hypothetical protein [Burkholderiales bacterium]
MNWKFRALVMGLALLVVSSAVQAANMELYVKNRPFQGTTLTRSGQLHAELGPLLQAIGYSWTVDGTRVNISRRSGGGPALTGVGLQPYLDGKPLALPLIEVQGSPFVPLADLARGLGLSYRPNPDLGIADLNVPVSRIPVRETPADSGVTAVADSGKPASTSSDKASSAKTGMIETDGTNRLSPIRILKTDFSDSTTPGTNFVGEVRTSTSIQNSSDKPLEKVTLRLRLMNLANEVVQEWIHPIGLMRPGAQVDFTPEPPVWYNYNRIQVNPSVLVEHQPQPDPEEEAASKGQDDGGK